MTEREEIKKKEGDSDIEKVDSCGKKRGRETDRLGIVEGRWEEMEKKCNSRMKEDRREIADIYIYIACACHPHKRERDSFLRKKKKKQVEEKPHHEI